MAGTDLIADMSERARRNLEIVGAAADVRGAGAERIPCGCPAMAYMPLALRDFDEQG